MDGGASALEIEQVLHNNLQREDQTHITFLSQAIEG